MIGKLSGRIDNIDGQRLIIDVAGVGYVVACSANTLRQVNIGESTSLLIETQVREDAISLFGFAGAEEQAWFKLLTTVQGVGAKVALSILSSVPPDRLAQSIAAQDKTALTAADGVGPKLALRIVTELKDKTLSIGMPALLPTKKTAGTAPPATSVAADALSALTNLGYSRAVAFGVIASLLQQDADLSLDMVIRRGLAELSQQGHAA